MAVDLFSLRMNIETSGLGQATAGLREIDAAGKQAALGATNFANAWEGAKIKFQGTAAEMAAFKTTFSAGFFDQKLISGMSLAGQEGAAASQGFAKMSQGIANASAQWKESVKAQTQKISSTGLLSSALGHLAAVYGGMKIIEFTHDVIESAAALHEMSQKTGASAQTLSILRFAAKQADVDMSQVVIGFRGMALSLGNLRDGQEKTVAAYQRLGFTAQSFAGLTPEQTFIKLATAVGGMKDETERAEVAQRVFGRSGSALIPLFEDMAVRGWGKMTEGAGKYHAIVSQVSADQADEFLDSLTRLKGSFTGLIRDGLTPILPLLTVLVEKLADMEKYALRVAGAFMRVLPVIGPLIQMAPKLGSSFGTKTSERAMGGFRGNIGDESPLMAALGPIEQHTEAAAAATHKAAETAAQRQARLLAILDAKAASKLPGGGAISGESNLALRTGGVGQLHADAIHGGMDDTSMGGSLEGDLEGTFAQGGSGKTAAGRMAILAAFANEARRQGVALKVQFATLGQSLGMTLANGFGAALGAAMSGKNVFKAFGGAVLSGLGSMFSEMGQKLVAYGLVMLKLLPFLSNPFTSGPAAIAAGIALMGLGAALGGIAHGSGGSGGSGGGGGDFRDRTTQITLTAAGAGGMRAPNQQVGPTIHVLGKDSPEGQRLFGEHAAAAKRSRNM